MLKSRRHVILLSGLAACLGLSGLSGLNSHAQIASSAIPARNQIAPATVSGTTARANVAPSQIPGRVRYQGDILLRSGASPQSVGVLSPQFLWPKVGGVATVYYVIDTDSDPNATPKINTAISTSNADFPGVLQWVQWTSADGPAYVDINLSADDFSGECEAAEGYEGIAAQPMTGSTNCAIGTILHEMGHVIGLWHEQSRSDSASYISFNYGNVIKGSIGNFAVSADNEQNLTPYDYASVMEYPSYSFTRNGGPVIETIPAGMPLADVDGVPVPANPDYSAGDKEGISRLYGAPPTQVTVTSNPAGLQVEVDGATITTPMTYAWALNSTHTIAVASGVQTLTGDITASTTSATFYYTYGRWNDSTAQSHVITVAPGNGQAPFPITSPQVTTYSANFIQLVPYTAAVYPANSGTVAISPQPQTYAGATGEFFVARQLATLTSTPAAGYNFYEFNNGPFWLPGGLGANPKTFYVPDTGNPVNTTSEQSTEPVYTVDVSPDSFSSNLYVYVDGGFAYTPKNFASDYDPSWTAGSSHTLNLDSPEYPYSSNSRYAFSSWSDGGLQSHTIASLPATATSYIATVTPQFLAGTNFNYPPCGGSGSLSPASPTNDGFYPTGQTLQYTATPDATWTFAGWTYDITGTTNPASLIANDETLVFANFNTVNSPLTLTSLSPASAAAGGAAFTLTLIGTGFSPTSLVSVNGQYRSVTYVSATELQVPLTAADIQNPALLQVFVENFPSGWNGCAVFGYQIFSVYTAPAAPAVSVSPASFTFANTTVGSTAAYKVFTLNNTGTASLTVSSITSTGTNASSFTIPSAHQLCTTVAAGSSCTFDVAFSPAAAGSLSASIQIADNATGSPQSVSVSGTGLANTTPAASISPTSFTFANTNVGSTAAYKVFTLTNTGGASLTISSITSTGTNATSFTIPSAHQLCTTVAVGANCTFDVAFTPTGQGSLSASIQIADNATGSPQSVSVSGTGVGSAAPAVSISPTSFTFANTNVGSTAAYKMFTLTNTGGASLTISSITSTGTNATSFTIPSAHQLCTTVAAGSNCTFDVAFTPTGPGSLSASIQIADNATGSPQSVSVSGTGVGSAAPAVSISPTSFTFANTNVGSTAAYKVFTLTNIGGASLTITSIIPTGTNATSFTIPSAHQLCTTVAAGASCTFDVAFTPTAGGSLSASIQVADNATGSPQSVSVSGTGVGSSAPVTISPASFTFANTNVGSTAAYKLFTLTNTGSASLTISSITSTGTNATSFTIPSNHQLCTTVAVGASCTFDVAFSPQATGALTASIQIADNATGSPQSVSVSGTGQ